ncbi:crAss001_48 related protein, partial [Xenorhabdus bovienii]
MTSYQIQPHQQRVMDEATELDQKIEKLSNFIGDST